MKIIVKKQLKGIEYTFEIEEEKAVDALALAGTFSSMPSQCKMCQSEDVHLSANKAKGFTFVKVICEKCNARSQLGQYKEGGFFWKSWENYNPPEKKDETASSPANLG